MTLYQFMTASPWLSGFIAFILIVFTATVIQGIVKIIGRQRNIYKHGWPPPHCDADGEFRKERKEKVNLEVN